MERQTQMMLRIGAWCVNPASGQILRDGESARVEIRAMRLLVYLAEHAGEVVSIDELLNQAWPDVAVAPDSVYQAVTSLRRFLGDDPKRPTYIETVPRLGYRMVAKVSRWEDPGVAAAGKLTGSGGKVSGVAGTRALRRVARLRMVAVVAAAAVCVVLAGAFFFRRNLENKTQTASAAIDAQPQKSIAVLPFLDLTEGMRQEEFADGMTEELIDRLSKIPDFRVTPPTSSFYYKGKQLTVAEIAKALGVAYVLDGSVRKSGTRVRLAVRLTRTESGYVVWSESYDRPLNDILMVQDEIAGKVTNALRTSIEAGPKPGGEAAH
jgi:transcriptional activator of cad operon